MNGSLPGTSDPHGGRCVLQGFFVTPSENEALVNLPRLLTAAGAPVSSLHEAIRIVLMGVHDGLTAELADLEASTFPGADTRPALATFGSVKE